MPVDSSGGGMVLSLSMAKKLNKTGKPMKCNRLSCGYEWVPKIVRPKKCPRCMNSLWIPKGSKTRRAA